MTDFDPNQQRRLDLERSNAAFQRTSGSGWGWILGVLFVVLIVGLVIAGSGDKQTADDTPVPNTTGQANRSLPMTPPVASRPATPPTTTGQGSSSMPSSPAPSSPAQSAPPAGQSQ